MTKREKNIYKVAKAINRSWGICMRQCLEMARTGNFGQRTKESK